MGANGILNGNKGIYYGRLWYIEWEKIIYSLKVPIKYFIKI